MLQGYFPHKFRNLSYHFLTLLISVMLKSKDWISYIQPFNFIDL